MLGMVVLPDHSMPKTDGMSNLNGWWESPPYVLKFWATGCYIEYSNVQDYENKKVELLESYNNCVKQFWSENVL